MFTGDLKIYKKEGLYILEQTFLDNNLKFYLQPVNDHQALVVGEGRMTGELVNFSEQGNRVRWSGIDFTRLK